MTDGRPHPARSAKSTTEPPELALAEGVACPSGDLPVTAQPSPSHLAPMHEGPILLYDGGCGLCHASVRRVLRAERGPAVRFAALDSATATALRRLLPEVPVNPDTVVFIEAGRVHLRSRAFFHLARHLRAPWRWLAPLRFLPAWLTDLPYRLVARLRYRLWGRADACQLPAPEHRARFLP